MLALSRMKALLLSAYPPILSKPNAFSIFSRRPSPSNTRKPLQNPSFFNLKSTMSSQSSTTSRNADDHRDVYGEASQPCSGEIHVIVGPMFAGKTTTLLRRIKSESDNGRSVAIVKSDKDTRYAVDSIVTHDGEKYPCWPLEALSSFKQKIGFHAYDKLDVIGIDEAQFFGDLHDFCRRAADCDGKTIIIAGLDGDYLRRKFGSVLDIIPLADSVTKLTARCSLCTKRAFFTLRKTDDTKTELIGGANVYMPVCREHYISGQVVKEATRSVFEDQKVSSG